MSSLDDRICEYVLSGKLPGGPLSEGRLATKLGVSRTPVREALLRLDTLIERGPRGFAVRALSSREVREIYPLIGALEALALDFHAGPLTSAAATELDRLNKVIKAAATARAAVDADLAWHGHLLGLSRNMTVRALVRKYQMVLRRYELAYFENTERLGVSVSEHNEIVDLLLAGKIEAAKQVLRGNWESGVDALAARVELR